MKEIFETIGRIAAILLGIAVVVWVISWAWHHPWH